MKELEAQHKTEREYYLGKTQKVPGSDKSMADLRKEFLEDEAKEEKRLADQKAEYDAEQVKKNKPVQTTFVSGSDTTVDVKVVPPKEFPTRQEALKLGKQDLVVLGAEVDKDLKLVPDSMTIAKMVDAIYNRRDELASANSDADLT